MSIPVTRVYTGDDGESHFEDTEVALDIDDALGTLSEVQPATGVVFRRTAPGQSLGWHNAPRRQYVVLLGGPAVEIEVGDGTTRRFESGSVILVEDTSGRGHVTRVTDPSQARLSLFIPLA